MSYKENQKKIQEGLIGKAPIFEGAEGGGEYRKKNYEHILKDGIFNLYEPIRNGANAYFERYKCWWGGEVPGNTLSSQVACVNHLFALRDKPEVLLEMVNAITKKNFKELLSIPKWLDGNTQEHYVAFEAVSKKDHLGEAKEGKELHRGSNCTSIDALMIAEDQKGDVWLLPIEWKYTETKGGNDKSKGTSGETRKENYDHLIEKSEYLVPLDKADKVDDKPIYYKEPFYQLMRQTLWAEQIKINESEEWKGAKQFLHIQMVPKENTAFRIFKKLKNRSLEDIWKGQLKDDKVYICCDPKDFFALLTDEANPSNPLKKMKEEDRKEIENLIDYLEKRYWQ